VGYKTEQAAVDNDRDVHCLAFHVEHNGGGACTCLCMIPMVVYRQITIFYVYICRIVNLFRQGQVPALATNAEVLQEGLDNDTFPIGRRR